MEWRAREQSQKEVSVVTVDGNFYLRKQEFSAALLIMRSSSQSVTYGKKSFASVT